VLAPLFLFADIASTHGIPISGAKILSLHISIADTTLRILPSKHCLNVCITFDRFSLPPSEKLRNSNGRKNHNINGTITRPTRYHHGLYAGSRTFGCSQPSRRE